MENNNVLKNKIAAIRENIYSYKEQDKISSQIQRSLDLQLSDLMRAVEVLSLDKMEWEKKELIDYFIVKLKQLIWDTRPDLNEEVNVEELTKRFEDSQSEVEPDVSRNKEYVEYLLKKHINPAYLKK